MSTAPPTLRLPPDEHLPLCGNLSVSKPGEANRVIPFPVPSVLSVGRSEKSDICLNARPIGSSHGRFVSTIERDGSWRIFYQNESDDSYTFDGQRRLSEEPFPLTPSVSLQLGWGEESITIKFTPFAPASFRSRFNVEELRATGSIADVFVVQERAEERRKFAAKVVTIGASERKEGMLDLCSREFELQRMTHDTHIIKMHEIIYEPTMTILIAELGLGDLADHLTCPFPPRLAKSILVQLAGGLDHIHSLGIIHRDIRPANIFLISFNPVIAKIGDFGSAAQSPASGICGRSQFCAPEALQQLPYGSSVDVWSLGTIMVLMLSGKMPFPEEDLVVGPNGVATLDRRSNPRCDDPKAFTKSGRNLIYAMLHRSPCERLTAFQVFKSSYLKGAHSWKEVILSHA